jgi:multidrug efflux system membrane fusion protein
MSRLFLCVIIFLGALAACSKTAPPPKTPPPAPVVIDAVRRQNIPIVLHAVGNVQAYSTVSVKSQVSGQITEVHFKEGQDVKKGDLLFQLDPRPFEAAVAQAQATYDKDLAQAMNSEKEAQRSADLVKKGAVAAEQNDQSRTTAVSQNATIRGDQAALDSAKLQLDFASIRSPIDARAGAILIHEGNLVKANDDASILVVLNQIYPIYVQFSVPEQHLDEIRRRMKDGALETEAHSPNDPGHPSHGVLTLIDNAVDQTTGTVKLKATFENDDEGLWPGEFVNTVLTLAQQPDAITIPAQAVQSGQKGQYVFVVKPDLTAELRMVEIARSEGRLAVVGKGLVPDERVIVDGQLRVAPGAKVEVKNSGAP